MTGIRYHLDEHIDRAIAVGLRQRGIDVTTTAEAGLLNTADSHQISFATAEGRVFVTCDRGIAREIPPGTSHSGIVIARSGRRFIGPIVLALVRLHRATTAEEMANRLEYIQ